MGHGLARPIVLASISGLLYPLCFPDSNLGWLAWVMLLPLHLALDALSSRQAFWIGWLAGLIAFIGTMSWVVTAMHQYGKMPLAASYAVLVLLAAYLGAYIAAYALAFTRLRRRFGHLAVLGAPCLWVGLELLRTYLLSGLPWALLGYSQYRWLPVIQIADLAGVYGVSFLILLVNVALAEAALWLLKRLRRAASGQPPPPFPWLSQVAAASAFVLALLYGQSHLQEEPATGSARTIQVGLVQANIDQAEKWDAAYRRATLDRYARLTAQVASGSDLVIWPEAATPFLFEQELPYRVDVSMLVRRQRVPLLFGSPALRYEPNGRPYLLNSAYLLAPDGELLDRYDKQHLVPFGEYIPLHSSALFFLDKLVEGIGDFEAGTDPTVMTIQAGEQATGVGAPESGRTDVRFGVVICYEVIFPNLVREFVARGADFMVTITNDAWFGTSAAPFQHFGMVVFRAVENRVAFARAANTGVSGFIDPQGRILLATPIFEEWAVTGPLPIGTTPTLYTRYGDLFAYICAIIAGLLLMAPRLRAGLGRGARDNGA